MGRVPTDGILADGFGGGGLWGFAVELDFLAMGIGVLLFLFPLLSPFCVFVI